MERDVRASQQKRPTRSVPEEWSWSEDSPAAKDKVVATATPLCWLFGENFSFFWRQHRIPAGHGVVMPYSHERHG